MKLTDVFTPKAIADNYTEAASNAIPYFGTGLFPARKKRGLDLKWLKGHKGLPVSLMPSNFDAKATFRDRVGIQISETQMPFFREAMIVKEADRQEIMRVQDANDPYAADALARIFDDTKTLLDGANVVPERMIMQLLSPLGGSVGIEVAANGVNYAYNYDPDGSWKAAHYMKLESAADRWDAADTCDPIADLEAALDAQESETGSRPEIALMSKRTFSYMKNSKKVQGGVLAQNRTANVNYTNDIVKKYVEDALHISLVIYAKKYKKEDGTTAAFYPDNIVMLLPNGALGNTWYGTTPEEADLQGSGEANVSIVNQGVAVSVFTNRNPVNTETVVSEIVLPSFERMDETYALEVAGSENGDA